MNSPLVMRPSPDVHCREGTVQADAGKLSADLSFRCDIEVVHSILEALARARVAHVLTFCASEPLGAPPRHLPEGTGEWVLDIRAADVNAAVDRGALRIVRGQFEALQ